MFDPDLNHRQHQNIATKPAMQGHPVRVMIILLIAIFLAGSDGALGMDITSANDQLTYATCCCSGGGGELWCGTESQGLWRLDDGGWKRLDTGDLHEGEISCLCCDEIGRLWIGTGRNGLWLYDGHLCARLPVENLGAGLSIRAIQTNVNAEGSSDVWIGTNCGLLRYSTVNESWMRFGTAQGIPGNHITAVAATSHLVVVGTDVHGVAIATRPFDHWRALTPDGDEEADRTAMRAVNAVAIDAEERVWIGTDGGLMMYRGSPETWEFLLGPADWPRPTQTRPQILASIRDAFHDDLTGTPRNHHHALCNTYVSALSISGGDLLIGHWDGSIESLSVAAIEAGHAWKPSMIKGESASRGSPVIPNAFTYPKLLGHAVASAYGEGMVDLLSVQASSAAVERIAKSQGGVVLPVLPSISGLIDGASAPEPGIPDAAVELPDDIQTRGDWLGRYGKEAACLSGICSPKDYRWGCVDNQPILASIGDYFPMHGVDSLRYWVTWLYTDNANSLELPEAYFGSRLATGLVKDPNKRRRQAEWDDHGETYPMEMDGPGIDITVAIPTGDHILSLYDFNKDGDFSFNRMRDYLVSISLTTHDPMQGRPDRAATCTGRIWRFRSGIYKRFLLRGPASAAVHVDRNHSWNTILCGVFLDGASDNLSLYAPNDPDMQRTEDAALVVPASDGDRQMVDLWNKYSWLYTHDRERWASDCLGYYRALMSLQSNSKTETAANILRMASYQAGDYTVNEAMRDKLRLPTARAMELSMKWDGTHEGNGTEGRYLNHVYRDALLAIRSR